MKEPKRQTPERACVCPYCNGTTKEPLPYCQVCGAVIVRCPRCGKVLAQGEVRCPGCGSDVAR